MRNEAFAKLIYVVDSYVDSSAEGTLFAAMAGQMKDMTVSRKGGVARPKILWIRVGRDHQLKIQSLGIEFDRN